MPDPFRDLLKSLIDRKYPSRRAFVRAAEPEASEDGTQAYLGKILAGKNPAPLHRIESWASALDLKPDSMAYDEFLELAYLTHLPDSPIVRRFRHLRQEVAKLKAHSAEQDRQIDALEQLLNQLESRLKNQGKSS